MSGWFGQSLQGISNLRGQLTDITREVLAESTEDSLDPSAELLVAKQRIKELEAALDEKTRHVDTLTVSTKDLREKLAVAEIQLQKLSQTHQQELVEKQAEITRLADQLSDLQNGLPQAATSLKTEPVAISFRSDLPECELLSESPPLSPSYELFRLRDEVKQLKAECSHWKQLALAKKSSAPCFLEKRRSKQNSLLGSSCDSLPTAACEAAERVNADASEWADDDVSSVTADTSVHAGINDSHVRSSCAQSETSSIAGDGIVAKLDQVRRVLHAELDFKQDLLSQLKLTQDGNVELRKLIQRLKDGTHNPEVAEPDSSAENGLDSLQDAIERVEALEREKIALAEALDELDRQNSVNLSKALEARDVAVERSQRQSLECAKLAEELASAQRESEQLKVENHELTQAYDDLNTEFERQTSESRGIVSSNRELHTKLEAMKADLVEYEERYEVCKVENSKAIQQLESLTGEFDRLKHDLMSARSNNEAGNQYFHDEINRLSQQLDDSVTQRQGLASRIEKFQQISVIFEEEVKLLKTEINMLKEDNERLKETVRDVEDLPDELWECQLEMKLLTAMLDNYRQVRNDRENQLRQELMLARNQPGLRERKRTSSTDTASQAELQPALQTPAPVPGDAAKAIAELNEHNAQLLRELEAVRAERKQDACVIALLRQHRQESSTDVDRLKTMIGRYKRHVSPEIAMMMDFWAKRESSSTGAANLPALTCGSDQDSPVAIVEEVSSVPSEDQGWQDNWEEDSECTTDYNVNEPTAENVGGAMENLHTAKKVMQLQQELSESLQELIDKTNDCAALQIAIRERDEIIQMASIEFELLKVALFERLAKDESARAETEKRLVSDESESFQQEKALLESQMLGCQRAYEKLSIENEELKSNMAADQQRSDELMQTCQNLSHQISSLEAEKEKLQTSLQDRIQQVDQLSEEVNLLKNQNMQLERGTQVEHKLQETLLLLNNSNEEIMTKDTELQNRATVNAQLQESVRQLQAQLVTENQKLEASAQQHEEELLVLRTQIASVRAELDSSTTDLSSCRKEKDQLEHEKLRMTESLTEIKRQLEERSSSAIRELAAEHSKQQLEQSLAKLTAENAALLSRLDAKEAEVYDCTARVESMENELKVLNDQVVQLAEYKSQLDAMTEEKKQFINVLNQKHEECLKYYNDLQQLNTYYNAERAQVESLQAQLSSAPAPSQHGKLEADLNDVKQDLKRAQETEKSLRSQLGVLEAQKVEMSVAMQKLQKDLTCSQAQLEAYDRSTPPSSAELEPLQQSVATLTAERDKAVHSLSQETDRAATLLSQVRHLEEKDARQSAEVVRLREHLMQIEDSYTQEALKAEERESELRQRLHESENALMQCSTSADGQMLNFQNDVDDLKTQLESAASQRDQACLELSSCHQELDKNAKAMQKLQNMVQHLQKERDSHAYTEVEKYKNEILALKRKHEEADRIMQDLRHQVEQFEEKDRLFVEASNEVQQKNVQIEAMHAQIKELESEIRKNKAKIVELKKVQDGKIERELLRNLLLRYFTAENDKKSDIAHLLGSIVGFSKQDFEKIEGQSSSWFGLLRLAGSGSSPAVTQQSITEQFVKFLESESLPKLPGMPLPSPDADSAVRNGGSHGFAYPTSYSSVPPSGSSSRSTTPHSHVSAPAGPTHPFRPPWELPTFAPSGESVISAGVASGSAFSSADIVKQALQSPPQPQSAKSSPPPPSPTPPSPQPSPSQLT